MGSKEAPVWEWKHLCRFYLDLQHLRTACEARIRKMEEESVPDELIALMKHYASSLKKEEKSFLKAVEERMKDSLVYSWCKSVKGLGTMACLMFMGFTNPFVADTAGKARAYWGLVPYKKLKAGERLRIDPEAKGRAWLIAGNVIKAGDQFYVSQYKRKKEYYLNNPRKASHPEKGLIEFPPMKEVIEDPSKCPLFVSCKGRIVGKAKRLGREPKTTACRRHVDSMARVYGGRLPVSSWLFTQPCSASSRLRHTNVIFSNFFRKQDQFCLTGVKS